MTTGLYYLTVSYNVTDLLLEDESHLQGPFATPKERDAALEADLGDRDLETAETVNVTFLRVEGGVLIRERSFTADSSMGEDEGLVDHV